MKIREMKHKTTPAEFSLILLFVITFFSLPCLTDSTQAADMPDYDRLQPVIMTGSSR
jgi:hypothetical protein